MEVHGGIVTLRGTANSLANRDAINDAAHRVHGVLSVVDCLTVQPDASTVRTDDAQDVWAFVRAGHGEELLVALNASDRPATVSFADLGDGWEDVFGTPGFADNGMVSATIPAVGGRVWHRRIK